MFDSNGHVGSRAGRIALVVAALCLVLGALAQVASAETTHKFIKHLNLPVGGVEPIGVDPQGNVIVWSEEEKTIQKFSPNGEPVDFSALGTNVLDGAGGLNCPATPSDCDRIPWDGFGPSAAAFGIAERILPADMNPSAAGPTPGYIYVAAVREIEPLIFRSRIVAFDSTGVYKGQIDTTQATPDRSPTAVPQQLSVSPNGSIVLTYNTQGGNRISDGDQHHADKYQAIDGDPAHDVFVGQLRKGQGPGLQDGWFGLGTVADDEYVYVGRGQNSKPVWELYDAASFAVPSGSIFPVNLDPNECVCDSAGPWLDGGRDEENNNGYFQYVSVNPADHHAFLLNPNMGVIEEWATTSQRVGPQFSNSEILPPLEKTVRSARPMAFDTSGIPSTNGRIYVQSKDKSLAVFGPPVPIPDIENLQVTVGHKTAAVSATIDLDHGPKVTECRVQWGQESNQGTVNYSQFLPCQPPVPYTEASTPITANITGLQTEKNYRVRVMVKTLNGVNRSPGAKFRPAAVLSVSTDPATNVTRTTAVLHGSLNPDGISTKYWFQYGIDTNYRNKTAEMPGPEGTESAAVNPVEITNLQSGRLYHFRLVAKNNQGTTMGPDQVFVAASAPAISGVRPSEVAETSATINARIDAGGYPTTYHFEYGSSASYGQVVPAEETSIGSANGAVPVSAHLADLEAGVTYHFKVVASNEWGTAESDDATFDFFPQECPNAYERQLTRSAYLPDCRAYELVSPGDAGAVQLYPGNITTDFRFFQFGLPHTSIDAPNQGTATNPPRFGFMGAIGAVSGTNPPNSLIDMYTSTRTLDGWVTRYWGQTGDESGFVSGQKCSLNMDVCIDYDLPELLGEDPSDPGSQAPYVWDSEGNSLGRWPTNLSVVKGAEEYIGADKPSPDFSHYVFSSRNIAFLPNGLTSSPGSVYDNDVNTAKLDIASRLAGGEDIPQDTGTNTEVIEIPAISTDGSHILMSTQAEGGVHLYMRVNDSITYEIAPEKIFVQFIGMTNDGSKVIFASRDQVTPDDTDFFGTDIYIWDEATNEITRLSQGNGAGNASNCSAFQTFQCSVTPLSPERKDSDDVIASENGDVYFYSPEQLDPSNPGVFNEKNLYVYRNGAVKYVATLDNNTAINRIQVSPDGSHVAFLTSARLTSYDNKGWREMYTFNPETGVVRCASCIPTGEPPTIIRPPMELGASGARGLKSGDVLASQSGRFMSDDGRVAFATSDALVESDTNGLVDVYEFVGGRPQLITSGTSQRDRVEANFLFPAEYTGLEAVSHDGTDIYLSTFDTLAPEEDFNGNFVKFYDARTAGGFKPDPARLPCVAADECHGDENAGPEEAVVGTGAELGSPSSSQRAAKRKAARRKAKRNRRKRANARKRAHRHGKRGHRHG